MCTDSSMWTKERLSKYCNKIRPKQTKEKTERVCIIRENEYILHVYKWNIYKLKDGNGSKLTESIF